MLARRVSAEGRTRAYVGGRSATAADLREVGGELLAFYGQHEHRRLTLASAQLEILDGFCGPAQARAARGVRGGATPRARRCEAALEELRERAGARERELDLLEFELAEIEAAGPSEAEEAELLRPSASGCATSRGCARAARGRRRGARARGRRRRRAGGARRGAARGLDGDRAASTPSSTRWPSALRALALEADDLGGELRRYGEGGRGARPARLDEVEERLAVLERLKRKHGGTIAAVLAHAERCRARRDELAGAEEALEAARRALDAARARAAPRGRRAARGARRGGAARSPARCASGSPSWRWRARRSRSR